MDFQERVSDKLRFTPFSGFDAIMGLDVAVDWDYVRRVQSFLCSILIDLLVRETLYDPSL